jgi:hypothetical protein
MGRPLTAVAFPRLGRGRRLVDAEVFGDGVHAHEPKNEQHDRERADDRERRQTKAPDSIEHELPRATWKPPGR